MDNFWIVVPMKETRHSKQRLAACLDEDQRRRLALTMFEDVLAALMPVLGSVRCLVATSDADIVAIAGRLGLRTLDEGANEGHTGAVAAAARTLLAEGASGFLTVPGDVPRVTPSEISTLLAAHQAGRAFTIAPSHDELGSNAVACSPPDAVPLRFGDDSFFPHLEAARRAGIDPTVVRLPGLAMDLDTPDDLARFMRLQPRTPTRTLHFLEGLSRDSTLTA